MNLKLKRLYKTIRPLKPSQLWAMIYFRGYRGAIPFKALSLESMKVDNISLSFPKYQSSGWEQDMTFNFLNSKAIVDENTWTTPNQSILWHYNLHYFDSLNSVNNTHQDLDYSQLILSWWHSHKALSGAAIAWDPYPTSLRAVNFCKWYWGLKEPKSLINEDLWSIILNSHYREIKRKLEIHIQANHLFANLKALWFLQATLPEYRKKESKWLCKKISQELDKQFDDTYGHFELSPMYHRIMLWDILDMISVGRRISEFDKTILKLENIVSAVFSWAKALSHPDGNVAFFNDASMGLAPSLENLEKYIYFLGLDSKPLSNYNYSGYIVESKQHAKIICDTAEIGPKFQPGHAHADTLSFELSIGKQRVIVNSGTSEYGVSAERLRQRSTAAHSTTTLNHRNSSDVWSGFRVGKRANVINRLVTHDGNTTIISATHDGFSPAMHTRRWNFSNDSLRVIDIIQSAGIKRTYIHLHPEINVKKLEGSTNHIQLLWNEGTANIELSNEVQLEINDSTWHPEFGKAVSNKLLTLIWKGEYCRFDIQWSINDDF